MAVVRLDRLAAGLTEADWARRLPLGRWSWSLDGTRLVSPDYRQRPAQAVVVDNATGKVTRVPLRWEAQPPSDYELTWGPGGRGFAAWRLGVYPGDTATHQLTVFDETGRPTRRYPLNRPFPLNRLLRSIRLRSISSK